MGRLTVVLIGALALAAVGGCGSSADPAASDADASGSLAGTSWVLTTYAPSAGAEPVDVPDGVRATAEFNDAKVSGSDGCNRYSATYTATDGQIAFGPVAGTKKACPGAEGKVAVAYLAALGSATSYAVAGETLTLTGGEGEDLLTFATSVPLELAGPTWVATAINNGRQGVESTADETEVTAVFAEDGTVSGSGGCNRFSGSYEVDGTSLTFGELASTLIGCPEPIASQETDYLAALERVSAFTIRDDVLELRSDDGALQVSYTGSAD